jgi:hypothetical protein
MPPGSGRCEAARMFSPFGTRSAFECRLPLAIQRDRVGGPPRVADENAPSPVKSFNCEVKQMQMIRMLWRDENGFIISSELVLVATILVIGMIVGLTTVRDQVVQELADVAGAISDIVQTFSYSAVTGHTAFTAGSDFHDHNDFCDEDDDNNCVGGTGSNCVNVNVSSVGEAGEEG